MGTLDRCLSASESLHAARPPQRCRTGCSRGARSSSSTRSAACRCDGGLRKGGRARSTGTPPADPPEPPPPLRTPRLSAWPRSRPPTHSGGLICHASNADAELSTSPTLLPTDGTLQPPLGGSPCSRESGSESPARTAPRPAPSAGALGMRTRRLRLNPCSSPGRMVSKRSFQSWPCKARATSHNACVPRGRSARQALYGDALRPGRRVARVPDRPPRTVSSSHNCRAAQSSGRSTANCSRRACVSWHSADCGAACTSRMSSNKASFANSTAWSRTTWSPPPTVATAGSRGGLHPTHAPRSHG